MTAAPHPSSAPAEALFSYPLPDLARKMQDQSELLLEFVQWAREMNAAMAAQRALLQAVVATHPAPKALLEHFQAGMDTVADVVPGDQVADYRKEMQLLQGMILAAVNRRP